MLAKEGDGEPGVSWLSAFTVVYTHIINHFHSIWNKPSPWSMETRSLVSTAWKPQQGYRYYIVHWLFFFYSWPRADRHWTRLKRIKNVSRKCPTTLSGRGRRGPRPHFVSRLYWVRCWVGALSWLSDPSLSSSNSRLIIRPDSLILLFSYPGFFVCLFIYSFFVSMILSDLLLATYDYTPPVRDLYTYRLTTDSTPPGRYPSSLLGK